MLWRFNQILTSGENLMKTITHFQPMINVFVSKNVMVTEQALIRNKQKKLIDF